MERVTTTQRKLPVGPGDITGFTCVAPTEEFKGVEVEFKLVIVKNSTFNVPQEELCFVDQSATWFVKSIDNGGRTGNHLNVHSLRKFERSRQYEFVKFYEL